MISVCTQGVYMSYSILAIHLKHNSGEFDVFLLISCLFCDKIEHRICVINVQFHVRKVVPSQTVSIKVEMNMILMYIMQHRIPG